MALLSQLPGHFDDFVAIYLGIVACDCRSMVPQCGARGVEAELTSYFGCLCVSQLMGGPAVQSMLETRSADSVRHRPNVITLTRFSLRPWLCPAHLRRLYWAFPFLPLPLTERQNRIAGRKEICLHARFEVMADNFLRP